MAPRRHYQGLRLSPDGSRLAFHSYDDAHDVWVWSFSRSSLSRITRFEGFESSVVWHPSEDVLFFVNNHSSEAGIYRQAADGSADPELLVLAGLDPSSISPDGASLVHSEDRSDPGQDLLVTSLTGEANTQPLLVSPSPQERIARFSPNGRFLVYQSGQAGDFEIYVRPYPDVEASVWPISEGGGTEPVWSADGTEVFYRSQGGLMVVRVSTDRDLRPLTPERLFSDSYAKGYQDVTNYDVSPDGRRFLMLKLAEPTPEQLGRRLVMVENWFEELERLVPVG